MGRIRTTHHCYGEFTKNSDPYKNGEIKGLLAITRGGLCPTGILARELDIRRLKQCVVSYESESAEGQTEAN